MFISLSHSVFSCLVSFKNQHHFLTFPIHNPHDTTKCYRVLLLFYVSVIDYVSVIVLRVCYWFTCMLLFYVSVIVYVYVIVLRVCYCFTCMLLFYVYVIVLRVCY